MNKHYTDAVMKLGEPTKKNVNVTSSFYLHYKCKMTTHENKSVKMFVIILLPQKFLQFDWLRADVFQLNLKHLHVKITVTVVTQNHQIMSSHELRKNGGKIIFENQDNQELKENSENQNTEKSTSTWLNVWLNV